MVVFVYCQTQ